MELLLRKTDRMTGLARNEEERLRSLAADPTQPIDPALLTAFMDRVGDVVDIRPDNFPHTPAELAAFAVIRLASVTRLPLLVLRRPRLEDLGGGRLRPTRPREWRLDPDALIADRPLLAARVRRLFDPALDTNMADVPTLVWLTAKTYFRSRDGLVFNG